MRRIFFHLWSSSLLYVASCVPNFNILIFKGIWSEWTWYCHEYGSWWQIMCHIGRYYWQHLAVLWQSGGASVISWRFAGKPDWSFDVGSVSIAWLCPNPILTLQNRLSDGLPGCFLRTNRAGAGLSSPILYIKIQTFPSIQTRKTRCWRHYISSRF